MVISHIFRYIAIVFIFSSFSILGLSIETAWAKGRTLNGFDLSDTAIPSELIFQGGPPRDGIPSIDSPKFVKRTHAQHLQSDDIVLGIDFLGIIKAYPVQILNWHEIVNDRYNHTKVLVSFCPLCGSGMAFSSKAGDTNFEFGVSGLLYKSDLLLYDRKTESLWSQIEGQAVNGPRKGDKLEQLPVEQTTWEQWLNKHPTTDVLTADTGYRRYYARDPYSGYEKTEQLYFPVKFKQAGYHPKERVVGLKLNNHSKAWPFIELFKASSPMADTIGNKKILVHFDKRSQSAHITDENGEKLVATTMFWFAWSAFHPETTIFQAK